MTPSPSRASNMRGKMVTKSIRIDPLGQIDHDLLSGKIDLGADRRRERNFVGLSIASPDIQKHTATPFVCVDHFAALDSAPIDQTQTGQIVQEVFARIGPPRFMLRNLDGPVLQIPDL